MYFFSKQKQRIVYLTIILYKALYRSVDLIYGNNFAILLGNTRIAITFVSPAKDKDLLRKPPNAERNLPNLCLEWRMSNQKQRCIEIMSYFVVV